MGKDSKNSLEMKKPKFYKLLINKYSILKNDYVIVERIVCTNDLYRTIGLIYCKSLEHIERIDYYEIKKGEKNEKN